MKTKTNSELDEENVVRAVYMVNRGECKTRRAAELCGTTFNKVRSRLRGHKPRHARGATNTLLFKEEEKAIDILHQIRCKSLEPEIIRRGYKETGLAPWNPECVLGLLRQKLEGKEAEKDSEEIPELKRQRIGEEEITKM
ncbi:hypothetical protein K3495_g12729 [Podosphaera aphanis]|nr:hypothetical protein K3495_g12729 [Podosphaera aphanis]